MWPFRRRKTDSKPSPGDMRVTPVDNPLDWREDGDIRPGDPAYDVFMEMMEDGKPRIMNQRPDGTWETRAVDE